MKQAAVQSIEGIVAGKVLLATPLPQGMLSGYEIGWHCEVRSSAGNLDVVNTPRYGTLSGSEGIMPLKLIE